MRRKTPEEVAWLEEHVPEAAAAEVREAFQERFGWAPTLHALQVWACKRGLRFGRWGDPAQNRAVHTVRWSQEPEMESWMLANDTGGKTTGEISRLFEERFGFPLSRAQVSLFRSSHGTQSRLSHGGGKPPVPVGTERVSKGGYIKVKIREKPTVPQSKDHWRFKHWLVWEKANGQELPQGWTVLFVDGDIRNFAPENLYALPRTCMAQLNNARPEGGWPDRETLEAAVSMVKLSSAITDAKNRPRPCAICGETFAPDPGNRYSQQKTCRACLDLGRKSMSPKQGRGICEKCGRTYEKHVRRQRFCSDCTSARSRRKPSPARPPASRAKGGDA